MALAVRRTGAIWPGGLEEGGGHGEGELVGGGNTSGAGVPAASTAACWPRAMVVQGQASSEPQAAEKGERTTSIRPVAKLASWCSPAMASARAKKATIRGLFGGG